MQEKPYMQPCVQSCEEKRSFVSTSRPRRIVFARPAQTVSVSVTGKECGMNCAHCGGHYLGGMRQINEFVDSLAAGCNTPKSVLVSGGCTPDGVVPHGEWPWLLAQAAPGTRLNCHAGLVDERQASEIARWADVVSYDFVSDQRIVDQVYRIARPVCDYIQSYVALASRVPTVPHICIGLLPEAQENNPDVEVSALRLIRDLARSGATPLPPAVVFIVFMPTRNTAYQDRTPPTIERVIRVLRAAKEMLPATPIHLGCMRPAGRYRALLDPAAVRAGVDLIVQPAPTAAAEARKMGLEIVETDECCVFACDALQPRS